AQATEPHAGASPATVEIRDLELGGFMDTPSGLEAPRLEGPSLETSEEDDATQPPLELTTVRKTARAMRDAEEPRPGEPPLSLAGLSPDEYGMDGRDGDSIGGGLTFAPTPDPADEHEPVHEPEPAETQAPLGAMSFALEAREETPAHAAAHADAFESEVEEPPMLEGEPEAAHRAEPE